MKESMEQSALSEADSRCCPSRNPSAFLESSIHTAQHPLYVRTEFQQNRSVCLRGMLSGGKRYLFNTHITVPDDTLQHEIGILSCIYDKIYLLLVFSFSFLVNLI
jgi:hypothetical protein